jgi:hypothetical protein
LDHHAVTRVFREQIANLGCVHVDQVVEISQFVGVLELMVLLAQVDTAAVIEPRPELT